MKLSCPACPAKYTIPDERLDGRRVRVRCKRCGTAFAVDATGAPEPVDAPPSAAMVRQDRRGAGADLFAPPPPEEAVVTSVPLTAARNENSVLFSLATLTRSEASPVPTASESSSLIDLRALARADAAPASASRADEIALLGGGGAFSPWLVPPVEPPPGPVEAPRRPLALPIGIAAAVAALLGGAAFAGARLSSAPAAAAPAAHAVASEAPPTPAPAPTPESAVAATATATATPVAAKPVAVTRAPVRPVEAPPPAATTSSAPKAKCCPGEDETTCHMRLAVGAPCDAPASVATTSAAPPFDRAAATRALSVSVASCKKDDGPTGPGHVKVTFQPNGAASGVELDPPYAGTKVGVCVAQRFRSVTVPPFSGAPLAVGKSFTVP